MTDPDDDSALTRPISVAELLAKNGTIGAPPVGGRRRRRRGNSDAVTVAELTGEIPIISDDDASTGRAPARPRREPAAAEPAEPPVQELTAEPAEPATEPEAATAIDLEPDTESERGPEAERDLEADPEAHSEQEPALTAAEAEYAAHLKQRNVDHDPIDFAPPPRRSQTARSSTFATAFPTTSTAASPVGSGAEQMSPDPVVDDDEMLDLGPDVDFGEVLDKHAADDDVADGGATARDELPSYLRSTSGTLFGGQSVADDLARRGPQPGPEDSDLEHAEAAPAEKAGERSQQSGSAFVRGAWVVAQCVLAVAFGAGLFIAFDQLWRWNTIVALVLSVLVILGLVVGVRVVRKTEDIGSTLIAVAVGALVTLGPLALLQSH